MREVKEYRTLDDIVDSVGENNIITGVYACAIEQDVGFLRALLAIFTAHWSEKIIIVLTLAFFIGSAVAGVPEIITNLIFFGGIILYLYIRGKRIRPSLLIATEEKLYLINEILYDNNTKSCNYDYINITKKGEVKKYFKLAALNPLYHLFSFHREMDGKKYIIARSPIVYLIFKKYYPKNHLVSFSKIKELFSPQQ